jgi:hypothetical protein
MSGLPGVRLGKLEVSKLIVGGNMFSGFSHMGEDKDREMRRYYTVARIKETCRRAERLGINAIVSRADNHVIRTLGEYWDEGGAIRWIAQTCSEMSSLQGSIGHAIANGAHAVYVHGGKVDWLFAHGRMDEAAKGVAQIRSAGLPAGVAAHEPRIFEWMMANGFDADFYMCAYYNPSPRTDNPMHDPKANETFCPKDRDAMAAVIRRMDRPVIHYKVMAGGRNDPAEAFGFVAKHLRPQDAVAVGVYTKDKPDLLEENIALLRRFGAA